MPSLSLFPRTTPFVSVVLFASACALGNVTKDLPTESESSVVSRVVLTCDHLKVLSGRIGDNQTADALEELELSGKLEAWSEYVEFFPRTSVTCSFHLPDGMDAERVTSLSMRTNYRGPMKSEMPWLFDVWNSDTEQWESIGDNGFAKDWRWSAKELALPIKPAHAIDDDRIEIRYRAGSNRWEFSQLDQLVLLATVEPSAPTNPPPAPEAGSPAAEGMCLRADGPGGQDTYALIRSALGPKSIEAPDDDHGVRHIAEDTDATVGHHFLFTMHRDLDGDPCGGDDRQRCEIKAYDGSDEDIKGREGDVFTFHWKFKLDAGMTVSKNFTHVFQLKSVDGDDGHPIVTITGAKVSGSDRIQVRWSESSDDEVLDDGSWAGARGAWLEATVRVQYGDEGSLDLDVRRLDGSVVLSVHEDDIDLWRDGDFVRPKWGIYRSLNDAGNLRAEEETVRFADFSIVKGAQGGDACGNGDSSPGGGSADSGGAGGSSGSGGSSGGTSGSGGSSGSSGPGIWQPSPQTTWQWQLTDDLDTSYDVDVYDIDLFDTPKSAVDQLHAQGRRVICYMSAGSYEEWRPDADDFLANDAVLGNEYSGWEDERWLDIRRIDLLGPIMEARLDLCQAKGFDGVEPDNIDAYSQGEDETGFDLSPSDQLAFNRWFAEKAHERGLSVGLKNDLDQVHDLRDDFDWALSEDCYYYEECDLLSPFVAAGKAVFVAEYTDLGMDTSDFCSDAKSSEFSAILKHRDLDAWMLACD